MIYRHTLVLALVLFGPSTAGVGAHHAFSPVYDGSRTVTINGTLVEFKLVNPHATMTLDVTDEAGKHETWTVELAGLLSLSRQGWTDSTVSPGDQLTIIGNPTHAGSARIAFRRLTLPNGRVLVDPNDNRTDAIEEQRRQRAREREQPR